VGGRTTQELEKQRKIRRRHGGRAKQRGENNERRTTKKQDQRQGEKPRNRYRGAENQQKKSRTIHEEREDEYTDTNGRAWKLRKVVRKQKENLKTPTDEEENRHRLQTPASPLISPGKYLIFVFLLLLQQLNSSGKVHACLFPTVPSWVTGLGSDQAGPTGSSLYIQIGSDS